MSDGLECFIENWNEEVHARVKVNRARSNIERIERNISNELIWHKGKIEVLEQELEKAYEVLSEAKSEYTQFE